MPKYRSEFGHYSLRVIDAVMHVSTRTDNAEKVWLYEVKKLHSNRRDWLVVGWWVGGSAAEPLEPKP